MRQIVLLLFIFIISRNSFGQTINIPDVNFKNRLLSATANSGPVYFIATDVFGNNIAIDINNNGEIELSEALRVYRLTVQNCSITNLTGIEFFTNITYLNCADNLLTSLNVTALSNLNYFRCDRNNLTSLNIDGLTNMTNFWYGSNHLPNVNANNNPNLIELGCDNNQIVNLDVSNLSLMTFLVCSKNNIVSLNLNSCISLSSLFCDYNSLINLDLSIMTNFVSLHCNNNPLVTLNLKSGNFFNYQTLYNINYSNCPNLSTICVDDFNVVGIQNKTTNYGYLNCSVNSNCNLDMESFNSIYDMKIFPNPSKNILNINSTNKIENYELLIYNTLEQVVKFEKSNQTLNIIDISDLMSGVYILKVIYDEKVIFSKFIKD